MIKKWAHLSYRYAWLIALLSIISLGFSIRLASHLKLRSDFAELLPDHYRSVKDLNITQERVGGLSNLLIGIESPDFAAGKQFVEDLVKKLETDLPPQTLQSIDYNVADIKAFFEKNKFLYIETPDLEEIYQRLDRSIKHEKLKKTGLLIDFADEDPKFNTKDIEEKYKSESAYGHYQEGYFTTEDGKLFAIVLRPYASSTSVSDARKLIADTEKIIQSLNPSHYHPQLKVGLAGKLKNFVREYDALVNDIFSTLFLVLAGVALAVYFYFRKLRSVGLMTLPVVIGCSWTFALTYYQIGYLTSQTAFLGSIIIGNGINYGLIVLARYFEERKAGQGVELSLTKTLETTWIATLASAITTSVGFGTLILTKVKGFSHFGFIGGVGLFFCWVATYFSLPAYIAISEKIWPLSQKALKGYRQGLFTKYLAQWTSRRPGTLLKIAGATGLLSVLALFLYIPNSLEYDFNKLKFAPPKVTDPWERGLHDRLTAIFPVSLSPVVILVNITDQAKEVCEVILNRKKILRDQSKVDTCKSLYSYIPEQQTEKLEILAKIRGLLSGSTWEFMNDSEKEKAQEFLETKDLKTVDLNDLPGRVVDRFKEKDGAQGKIVFVYSKKDAELWNGRNLIQFANEIRKNELKDGTVIYGSGQAVIFSDLLGAVAHDGPLAVVISFVAIMLVVLVSFWNIRQSWLVLIAFTLGIFWQVLWIYLFNIKLNFLNFIALPTTYGIGVDYAVNIVGRYKHEGRGGIQKTVTTTGGAVILCSITTIIGYLSLIISNSQALVSFGHIALIGEFTCLISALIILPAYILRRETQGKRLY
ncbi:MAG: MMPL family transporter [Deltaproteobacteria bacterium]|nr:MMPL family transporter [Deltaproteobacteria bacterium]